MMLRLLSLCTLLLLAPTARSMTVLFDSLVQDYLQTLANPLLVSAGLSPREIPIRVILADGINAFVTPDRTIYFYSGLITEASSTAGVRGVMAHEIGHISGQHLPLRAQQLDRLRGPALLNLIVGAGAVVAGAGQAGTAIIAGGQSAITSNILQHSRTHERQADQTALQLLAEHNYSASGLRDFFEVLRNQELLYARRPPAYLSTHPLSPERLETMRHAVTTEASTTITETPTEAAWRQRVQARLGAYQYSTGQTLRTHFGADTNDTPAREAQAIAYARQGRFNAALNQLAPLVAANDPYSLTLAGEIALDAGALPQARQLLTQALAQNADLPLASFHLARTALAQNNATEALELYRSLATSFNDWPLYWRQRGVAAGRAELLGESHVALAEAALLMGDTAEAKLHLQLAQPHLDAASSAVRVRHTQQQQALEQSN